MDKSKHIPFPADNTDVRDIQPFHSRDKTDDIAIPDLAGMLIDFILRNIIMWAGTNFFSLAAITAIRPGFPFNCL